MHLLKCAIGTGILFLPHAFRRTGYTMSIICGIVISTVCIHTAVIVVRDNAESKNFFVSNVITNVSKTITISEKLKEASLLFMIPALFLDDSSVCESVPPMR